MKEKNGTPKSEAESAEGHVEDELMVCLSCLHENVSGRDLCEKCGAPIGKYTTFMPLERTLAEGVCYRSAVSNPRRPIIVIGIWFLFLPGSLLLFYSLFIVWSIAFHKWPLPSGCGVAGSFFFLGLISTAILYRTTSNYIKMKKAPHQSAPAENATPSE